MPEINSTPLESVRMHDYRESYLNDPGWIDTQSSADLVRGLFNITEDEISPVTITSHVIKAIATPYVDPFKMILINKFRTGTLWEFTTDFGWTVLFQKIPHKDGVNSLRIVLQHALTQRPLVEYVASGCTFFEPSERVENTESEETHEPQKDISDPAPNEAQPPAAQEPVPAQENLSPVPDGSAEASPSDGAGNGGSDGSVPEVTREPDVIEEDDDDDWGVVSETPSDDEFINTPWPKRIGVNFSILVDGDANVRDSNKVLEAVRKILTDNEIENPADLTTQLTNTVVDTKHCFEFSCERTGPESITIWTKTVPSTIVNKLLENPAAINTIWARAEERCGGMKDGEDLDDHVRHVGRVIAKALKAPFIRATISRPDYIIDFAVERFEAKINSPIYASMRPGAATEEARPPKSTLKEEVAKVDAQAIAHGETTVKEVEKVNEAMAETEGTPEVEATPMPEQVHCDPLNVKVTFNGITTEQLDTITEKLHELFSPLSMEDRLNPMCQFNILANVLTNVLGADAPACDFTHEYRDSDKTFVVEQIVKEPMLPEEKIKEVNDAAAAEYRAQMTEQAMADKGIQPVEEVINNEKKETDKMIIVRVNCKEIVDQPDIDKMRAVIENYWGADADPKTDKPADEALSDLVSQAVDYECIVETVKQGEEYVVTVPTDDDEPEQPVPQEPGPNDSENPKVDEDELARQMMSEKDTTPVRVDPNWIDIEDPAVRQQCIQILFPDILEPSFMHLMHFLKDHHRKVGTPSFLVTKETIPTETTIVYDNLTFSIVKMKDGRFWRMFVAHTDFNLRDHDWISTCHIHGRWFQLGHDIHDNNQRSFQRGGFRY